MTSTSSIDWDRVRAKYDARVQWEIEQGLDPVEAKPPVPTPPKKPRPSRATGQPSRRGENLRERPPRYDRDEFVRLWDEGLRITEIAERTGANRRTVSAGLRERGVDTSSRGGPAPREKCLEGHSMKDAIPMKNGGRACRKCKQRRDREYHRRRAGTARASGASGGTV